MVVCRSNAADYESVNRIAHGCGIYPANGKRLKVFPMVIPCQAAKAEGVTTSPEGRRVEVELLLRSALMPEMV